jgi:hypothetical protein
MPKSFDKGVSYYTHGTAKIDVYFPEDDIRCKHCDFCYAESEMGRFRCRLTKHMVYNPNYAELPEFCPIKINEEKEK